MKFKMPTGEIAEQKTWPMFKTPYNHDTNFESDRTATYCPEPSLTKQEFVEDSDINTIMNRLLRTGEPPEIALPEHFLDVTGRTNYYDMATKVAQANELFYELPAQQRSNFLNDPNRWAQAVVDAVDNGDQKTLKALGIALDETGKPQTAPKADPLPEGTPAPVSPPGASGAPTSGAPVAGLSPAPNVTAPK